MQKFLASADPELVCALPPCTTSHEPCKQANKYRHGACKSVLTVLCLGPCTDMQVQPCALTTAPAERHALRSAPS